MKKTNYSNEEKKVVDVALELHKLLYVYSDEEVFNELKIRGYSGIIRKEMSISNPPPIPFDDDLPFRK